MPRVLDFDAEYERIHDDGEQKVIRYKGEDHALGEIPAFTQMRMAAFASGNYDMVEPDQVERLLDMLKSVCPSLADEMETWSMDQFRAFMSIFSEKDEDPNASTASPEEPVERSESPATVSD